MACWVLEQRSAPADENQFSHIWLRPDRQPVTVGRKDCSITLVHLSVSRRHLQFTFENSGGAGAPVLCVTDLGSKLRHGDTVTVAGSTTFVVNRRAVSLCVSSRVSSDFISRAAALSLQCTRDWTDASTHMVTPDLMVTSKLVHALLDAKPIVVPGWFDALIAQPMIGFEWPAEATFLPPLAAPLANAAIMATHFAVNEARKTLFSSLTFFAPPGTSPELLQFIGKAGGTVQPLPSSFPATVDPATMFVLGTSSPDPRLRAFGPDVVHASIVQGSVDTYFRRGIALATTQRGITQPTQGDSLAPPPQSAQAPLPTPPLPEQQVPATAHPAPRPAALHSAPTTTQPTQAAPTQQAVRTQDTSTPTPSQLPTAASQPPAPRSQPLAPRSQPAGPTSTSRPAAEQDDAPPLPLPPSPPKRMRSVDEHAPTAAIVPTISQTAQPVRLPVLARRDPYGFDVAEKRGNRAVLRENTLPAPRPAPVLEQNGAPRADEHAGASDMEEEDEVPHIEPVVVISSSIMRANLPAPSDGQVSDSPNYKRFRKAPLVMYEM